jgi:hypothetical protein
MVGNDSLTSNLIQDFICSESAALSKSQGHAAEVLLAAVRLDSAAAATSSGAHAPGQQRDYDILGQDYERIRSLQVSQTKHTLSPDEAGAVVGRMQLALDAQVSFCGL